MQGMGRAISPHLLEYQLMFFCHYLLLHFKLFFKIFPRAAYMPRTTLLVLRPSVYHYSIIQYGNIITVAPKRTNI